MRAARGPENNIPVSRNDDDCIGSRNGRTDKKSSMVKGKMMKKKTNDAKNHELMTKEICSYLAQNMDKRVTINELSEIFHISATQLKVTFKDVSGSSIYAYQRRQKMMAAAMDLSETDDSVLKIAGRYGYENGSKFAKAFRDTMGMSPSAYRNAKCSAGKERTGA